MKMKYSYAFVWCDKVSGYEICVKVKCLIAFYTGYEVCGQLITTKINR